MGALAMAVAVIAQSLFLLGGGAAPASAADISFPYTNDFAASPAGGTLSGNASIANNWLTLTPNLTSQVGAWQMDDTFSASLGIDVTFDYATYGGGASGADGFSFFLSDGASPKGTGARGAALGYAAFQTITPATNGIPGGFVGIGFDEFGSYSGRGFSSSGEASGLANTIAVRGSGDGLVGYNYITRAVAPGGIQTGDRAGARSVRVTITPDAVSGDLLLTVWSNSAAGEPLQRVLTDVNLTTAPGQAPLPESLRIGFAAGTGGSTNAHEIKNLEVSVPSDLAVVKTAPATVVSGTPLTYTIVATNESSTAVVGAAVQDTVPGALTDVTWTCVATVGACGAASGTGNVIDTTADLPVNGEVTYTVTGTAGGIPGVVTNTATIATPSDRNDTDQTNNTSTASTTVTASADLSLTKTTPSSTTVAPGSMFDYVITASNAGPSDASAVVASDPLPTGLSFVSSADGCTAAGQTVTCGPEATIANGASKSWTFTVQVDPAYTGDGTDLGNVASVTSTTPDPNPGNGTNPATPPPGGSIAAPSADLTLAKTTPSSTPVAPGVPFEYTLTATNAGPSDAQAVQVSDPLPDGLTFVSSAEGCTASAQTVSCGPEATISNGASKSWTFQAMIDPSYTGDGSDLGNVATVTSTTADPDTANNSNTAVPPPGGSVALGVADLSTTKTTPSPTPVAPGQTFDYTITVANAGPSDAKQVEVTDPLPAGLMFVSSTDGCTASGQTVFCGPRATVAIGSSTSWTFTVRLDASYTGDGSDLGNVATASAATVDPNPANDSNTPTPPPGGTIAQGITDLATSKETVTATPVAPGQSFSYRITVNNAGPSDAQDVQVSDPLPAGLTFVSSADGCTASGRTVTCGSEVPIPNDASKSWVFTVQLDADYSGDGSDLGNVATASATTTDPNSDNDSNTPTPPPGGTIAPGIADLATTKTTATNAPLAPGESFDYTITVDNEGPSTAKDVVSTDPLPAGVSFVSSTDGCTASGQTVTCGPAAEILNGGSTSWTFTAKIDSSYTGDGSGLGNVASAAGSTTDPNPGNDSNPPVLPPGGIVLAPSADLATSKAPTTSTPVAPGETFDYRITASNAGPSDAATVQATDPLPAGLLFVSSVDDCSASGQVVTCGPENSVADGDAKSWVFTVRIDPAYTGDGSDLGNVASVTSTTPDPDPTNGANPPVLPPGDTVAPPAADLETTKRATFPTAGVKPGDVFSYTISVVNHGPSNAVNVEVTDPLRPMLSFVSSADGCTASEQIVTCPTRPALEVGDTATWTINVRLAASYTGDGSDVKNVASATSPTADPNPDNNSNDPNDASTAVTIAKQDDSGALAFTGSAMQWLVIALAALLLGGGGILIATRRKTSQA